jgi:hypothetical protein
MFHLLDVIVISICSLLALSLILLVILINRVLTMEKGPGRDLVFALIKRTALTSGVLIVDPTTLPIPGIGELVTLASVGLVGYYWWTFFRKDVRAYSKPTSSGDIPPKNNDIEIASKRLRR